MSADVEVDVAAKRALAAETKAYWKAFYAAQKARRRRQRRCFWTRPFGHVYRDSDPDAQFRLQCVGCGRATDGRGWPSARLQPEFRDRPRVLR